MFHLNATSISIAPATTFHLLPLLPTELRLKIWSHNLPGPRLVPVHYASVTGPPSNPRRGHTSTARIPVNLHVNREAREQALQAGYRLSFNLPHCAPKIFFNPLDDVLYFPVKQGWLGSWNHFVTAVSIIAPLEVRGVKRIAVHESLFTGVKGARSSRSVQDSCCREFWGYVERKFPAVEEVVVFVERRVERKKEGEVRGWVDEMLGFFVGKNGVGMSSGKALVERLERGVRVVERERTWIAPRWEALEVDGDVVEVDIEGWPKEWLKEGCRQFNAKNGCEALDGIVIPHSKDTGRKRKGLWRSSYPDIK